MTCHFSDLAQKTFFLSGASRGIGKAIALKLAEQKAHIVFNYRSDESAAYALTEEIKTLGGSATALHFDITETQKMSEALDSFFKSHPQIHGIVNNAGVSKDQLCLRVKPDDIDHVFSVNLKGAMILTNILAKYLMKMNGSSIVNISSVVGLMGNPAQSVYTASKAGLIGYSKALAKELAARNVRVNSICPGFIATDMTSALPDATQEKYLQSIPLNSFGRPQQVADLTCFLLSDASSYITGEVIKIDGGLYI